MQLVGIVQHKFQMHLRLLPFLPLVAVNRQCHMGSHLLPQALRPLQILLEQRLQLWRRRLHQRKGAPLIHDPVHQSPLLGPHLGLQRSEFLRHPLLPGIAGWQGRAPDQQCTGVLYQFAVLCHMLQYLDRLLMPAQQRQSIALIDVKDHIGGILAAHRAAQLQQRLRVAVVIHVLHGPPKEQAGIPVDGRSAQQHPRPSQQQGGDTLLQRGLCGQSGQQPQKRGHAPDPKGQAGVI